MSHRLIRRPELLARLGVTTATIYDWMDPASQGYKPDFPRPLTLSRDITGRATVVAWRESDVDAWVASLDKTGGNGRNGSSAKEVAA